MELEIELVDLFVSAHVAAKEVYLQRAVHLTLFLASQVIPRLLLGVLAQPNRTFLNSSCQFIDGSDHLLADNLDCDDTDA